MSTVRQYITKYGVGASVITLCAIIAALIAQCQRDISLPGPPRAKPAIVESGSF
jgi:hypothetical protein